MPKSICADQPLYKSLIDYPLAMLLVLACALPMTCIALAIKLDSSGPIFFRQPRVGLDGRIFRIWKFRTMYQNNGDLEGAKLTVRNDPRVTRIGVFLRRWSIDEIPQLLNVLAGDMSIVGPRPHPIMANVNLRSYAELVTGYDSRHQVKPGITGWAQVNGWRGETTAVFQLERRVAHDLEYIAKRSLRFDLWIIILTTVRVWRERDIVF